MTYGWAILIIAVVLIALFQLGVFNGSNLAPKAQPGSCEVVKNTQGTSLAGQCDNNIPQYVAQFNGQSSYIGTGTAGLPTSPLTISAWVYPTSLSQQSYGGGTGGTIIEGNQNGGSAGYILGIKNTGLIWWWPSGGNASYSTGTVSLNRWTYVTITYDGTNLKIYFNGNLDSSQSSSTPQALTFMDIGGKSWITGYFNGSLSNVQIYNTSLSANDVAALYQEGIGGHPLAINNLVGWWPLNGNANDYSGNNNDGTATDVAYTGSWTSGYSTP